MTQSVLDAGRPGPGAPEPQPRPLLLVEDSRSDAFLIRESLVDEGWDRDDVHLVETVREAQQALTSRAYAAILLDLTLPDASGLEAVSVISSAAPAVPIVVVTGRPGDSVVVAALIEGADEFLSKHDLSGTNIATSLRRAIARRKGEGKHRLADIPTQVFDAVDSPMAVLDGTGTIVGTNRAWDRFAIAGGTVPAAVGTGVSYLRVCEQASGAFADGAREAAAGIRAVLDGTRSSFLLEYPCPADGVERWFLMRAAPLGRFGGGAVVTHTDITPTKHAELHLQDQTAVLATIVDEAAPIFAVVDETGRIVEVTPATQYLLGLDPDDVIGADAFERIEAPDIPRALALLRDCLANPRERYGIQLRALDGAGRWRDLDLVVVNLLGDDRIDGIVVTGSDRTAGRLAQIAAHLESRLLQRLPAAVTVTDERGVIVYWNDRAEELYGHRREDVVGRPAATLGISPTGTEMRERVSRGIFGQDRWESELDARRGDGSFVPIFVTMEPVQSDEIGFRGVVAAAVDITERRRLESDLAFRSLHDPLTGLPNRQLFVDHVDSALERTVRSGAGLAVLVVDLDHFKSVNDVAGHAVGDIVLETVGAYLTGLVQPGDVVARLAGDEFAVCCSDVRTTEEAVQVAEQILQVLRAPFVAEGREFVVSASIGIAFAGHGRHADGLVRAADAAMYTAKEAGRGRIEIFDDDAHELARARRKLALELAEAIDGGQLVVYYQPEVEISTGTLTGFEALVRWRHPERGLVPPLEFIQAAEESGLIGRLGEQVLEAACAQTALWQTAAPEQHLVVGVNVSAQQLADPDFPAVVRRLLATHDVPAGRLCLEVTESALLAEEPAEQALRQLKAIGVLIAVDDFGTGYSSLSRLKRFPVDYLKVDRSFVQGIGSDPEDEVIVSSVVNLAHSLGLEVIAEGIERVEQLEHLAAVGCELGQGYLWSKPVEAQEATELLVRGHQWLRATTSNGNGSGSAAEDGDPGDAMPVDARAAVSLLAHELSGPLTVLAGFAELLVTAEDPELRASAGAAVERAARLARSSLSWVADVAQLDHGTLRLNRREHSLGEVVADAVALAEAKKGPPVSFALELGEDVVVDVDRERLVGAVANLLVNARKFSPALGTVTVRAERSASGSTILHVLDDGPGIPADRVGGVFRKFGRADRERSGSGLGLYLARGVARAHGGELTYRRRATGGSDFVLELPAG